MKNSIIISSLLSVISSFFAVLRRCLEGSAAWRFIDKYIVSKIKNQWKDSFFVNLLLQPVSADYASGSAVFGFFHKILVWLRKIGARLIVKPLRRSCVVRHLSRFYSDILNYSLRHWGIAICSFAVLYSAFALGTGAMTAFTALCAVFAIFAGLVCCAVETSAYNFFTGSILCRMCSKFFGAVSFEDRSTIPVNRYRLILCIVFGALLAVASAFYHPVYAIAFAAGILAVGWIAYDYTVGIFIAAVVLAVAPTMALVGLIMFTFMSFLLSFARDEKMKFKRTPLDVPLLLFASVLGISAIFSFAFMSSAMAVMVYFAFILSYYLLTNALQSKERLYCLIVFMLVVGLFVAAYGIYQHIFGFAEGTVWTDTDMFEDIETRVVSTFENPNVLGEYLLLIIPICVGVIVGRRGGFNKLIHLGIVAALSMCMIYTYSRGNWIGLLVAIFMFCAFYDKRFIWLTAVAVLLSPLFLPESVINRFFSVGDMDDSSTSYRVYIWIGTLRMLKDYWFSGIGIGEEAFRKIYEMYSLSAVAAPHSHNLYLQIITENGIMGIIAFGAVMVVYFKMCISTITACRDKLLKALTIGLASGMLGYLIQGLFDNVWYNYRVFLLFFIILGITAVCTELAKNNSEEAASC